MRMEEINKYEIFKDLELDKDFVKNIKLFYILWKSVFIVTNDDKTYVFGRNTWGVLGFGHENEVKELTINEDLSNKQFIDFRSSLFHTIARTTDGKLYCWGSNGVGYSSGFLGNGRKDRKIYKPELNKHLCKKHIIEICCGELHSLALTIDGQVYAWGHNRYGQIGNRKREWNEKYRFNDYVSIPYRVNGFRKQKVKAIACGVWHSMALTEKGKVFSWGWNKFGQLGFERSKKYKLINMPKLISIGDIIEKISCGREHSLLLSRDGDIYVFGVNKSVQLGNEKIKEQSETTLNKLKNTNKFIDIASHSHYDISAAISTDGIIYLLHKNDGDVIFKLRETQFNSYQELFAYCLEITYKSVYKPFKGMNFETSLKLRTNECEQNFNEICVISSGSFGTVYKVVEKNSSEIYAIKKIPFSEDQEEKIYKELEIMAKVGGDHVVRCYNFWIEENRSQKYNFKISKIFGLSSSYEDYPLNKPLLLHIQMELCYKTLRGIIDIFEQEINRKLDEMIPHLNYYVSSELFKEILESLDYLHKQNPPIIHRDLKPANILITNGFSGKFIKLADFGLAVFHESEDQSHTQGPGTDKYMAPEVKGSRNYGIKADIYSLGVIVEELFNLKADSGKRSLDTSNKIKIANLMNQMTLYVAGKRPNCDEILNRKDLWDTSFGQFFETKKLTISDEIITIGDNFHLYFIKTKLNQRSFAPNVKEYEQNFREIEVNTFGTFGIIAKAVEKKSNEIFAISKITLSEELRDIILEELKSLASIKSEFLIEFHEYWVQDNYYAGNDYKIHEISYLSSSLEVSHFNEPFLLHIQMEPFFKSLKEVIQMLNEELNQKPSQVMSLFGYYISSELFVELLESVNYLHNQNIIHGDLISANIPITSGSNGRFIKLVNFGSAIIRELNKQTHAQGSRIEKCVAPEVMRGKNYDFKADVYSLGFVIQELFNIDVNE